MYENALPCHLQTYSTKTGALTVIVHCLHNRRHNLSVYAFPYDIFMCLCHLFSAFLFTFLSMRFVFVIRYPGTNLSIS